MVQWREGVPLYLEEAEIEDTSKIQLDWLIDIENFKNMEEEDKLAALDDVSVVSFSEQSFFLVYPINQHQVDDQQETFIILNL